MASKRKVKLFDLETDEPGSKRKHEDETGTHSQKKKHTLDSDEEDSGDDDRYNVMPADDIEGEEEGVSGVQDEVKITPFNMKEELEEGHFDKSGHFQWDKDKEIRDNWLDNIDWIKVKTDKNYIDKTNTGLADSSDSDDNDSDIKFDVVETYKQIFELMKPGETVTKTLQRLGGKTVKLSSVERWRRKKAGIVDENAAVVTKFTELANKVLTKMGNMDIYQETYDIIKRKINKKSGISSKIGNSSSALDNDGEELDMYADDFDVKEKKLLVEDDQKDGNNGEEDADLKPVILMWEFKWKQEDNEIHGPFSTEQMQKWVDESYFKDGVFVRKCDNEDTKFYTSNRIDFELYL